MVKLTCETLSPNSKVMVMPNTYKKGEKESDYFFYLLKIGREPLNEIGEDYESI